jgi:hypothetical protein
LPSRQLHLSRLDCGGSRDDVETGISRESTWRAGGLQFVPGTVQEPQSVGLNARHCTSHVEHSTRNALKTHENVAGPDDDRMDNRAAATRGRPACHLRAAQALRSSEGQIDFGAANLLPKRSPDIFHPLARHLVAPRICGALGWQLPNHERQC